jgi:serine protease Do
MGNNSFKRYLLAPVLVSVLLGTGYGISKTVKAPDAAAASASKSEIPMVPGNFSELAENVRPGVVNIQVVKKVKNVAFGSRDFSGNPFGEDSPFGDFFGPYSQGNPSPAPEQRGVGSGFIMSRDGYIVTNNHVVEDADQIKVKLANAKKYDDKIVARDTKTDMTHKVDGASDLHPFLWQFG